MKKALIVFLFSVATTTAEDWAAVYETPTFSDPAGIALVDNNLIVVDSEVNETTPFDRPNLFVMTVTGVLRSTTSIQWFTREATGIDYNDATETFYISEDNRGGRIHSLKDGPDRRFGTGDDIVFSLRVRDIGIESKDLEGVSFQDDKLYIAAGIDATVHVVDVSGGLESAFLVRSFPVAPMTSIEGLTVDGSIVYAVGERKSRIFAFDLDGNLIGEQLLPSWKSPSGIALDTDAGIFYIADRGIDNNKDRNEDDGYIYVIQSEFH